MAKLVCDKCGGASWHDGPTTILTVMPPITVKSFICARCGATREITSKEYQREPHAVKLGANDTIKTTVSTDAVSGPDWVTMSTDTVVTGSISSDTEFTFKK